MLKAIVVITSTLAILFVSGCGPSPADNARRNFLHSFGEVNVHALRVWSCDGYTIKGKDAEVTRCEYMIHGGYVNKLHKYCSTKPDDGCAYNEKGER